MRNIILTAFIFLWGFISGAYSQDINCQSFKTGKFKLTDDKYNVEFLITRNDSIQTETDLKTGQVTEFRISWESDCKYSLRLIEGQQDIKDLFGNKKLNIEIIEIYDDSYKFSAKLDGIDMVLIQIVKKIE